MTSIFSRYYDTLLAPLEKAGITAYRRRLIHQARGNVLEVGCGTGLNFPFYLSNQITHVEAIEPDHTMRKKAIQRANESSVPFTVQSSGGEALPFPNHTFDTVVCSLVLCTIPDPFTALQEIRRVCKPDGEVLLFEHVRMPQSFFSRIQDVLTPVWKKLCDGCHLNRDSLSLVQEAGFTILHMEHHMKGLVLFGALSPNHGKKPDILESP